MKREDLKNLKAGDKLKCIDDGWGNFTKGKVYEIEKERSNGLHFKSNDQGEFYVVSGSFIKDFELVTPKDNTSELALELKKIIDYTFEKVAEAFPHIREELPPFNHTIKEEPINYTPKPIKTVKRWKWALRVHGEAYVSYYYYTEEVATKRFTDSVKLPWTEQEFEVE